MEHDTIKIRGIKGGEIIKEIIRIVEKNIPNHPYHNFDHTMHVYEATQLYAHRAGLSTKESFLLGVAALFHDIVFIQGDNDNEKNSALFAASYLKERGFAWQDIDIINGIILATHLPTNPKTELEEMMCDADVDYLGTDNFFLFEDRLRKEWGITDDKKWWDLQVKFLEHHKYYSEVAQNLRNAKKFDNLKRVNEILEKLKKTKK